MPLWTQYSKAAEGYPPLHPAPHSEQHETKSSAEKRNFFCPLVAMQYRSVIASVAANA